MIRRYPESPVSRDASLDASRNGHVFAYASSTYRDRRFHAVEYALVAEEPLEIVVDGKLRHATTRTPDRDADLAVGFCFTEDLIEDYGDVAALEIVSDPSGGSRVVVDLKPRETRDGPVEPLAKPPFHTVRGAKLFELRKVLESRQVLFSLTGATHACAVFDREGELLASAEDLGRHNALEKAIGALVKENRQGDACLVMTSSRLSATLMRKVQRLGLEMVAGMSAPSKAAVDMAHDLGLTLVGFLRGSSFTVYTHPRRIRA